MASRTQKAKWNISTSLISQIVSMICGLIVPQLLLRSFGSELYGATTSIAHFLAYISLLEGGVSGVARAGLYQPLANGDIQELSNVYHEIKKFFKTVGICFVIYTVVLAVFYNRIVTDSKLEWMFSFQLVMVISLSTLAQYFFGIANSIVVQADQRHYVINIITILVTAVNAMLVILLTRMNCDMITVKFVSSCVFTLKPAALFLYVKRKYSILPRKQCGKTAVLSQKWTALGQHIAYFLHCNTDVVVLTLFVNLKAVAVYSVYSMVVSSVRSITSSFANGLESVFGNMYAKGEREKLEATFGYYETLISVVAVIMFSVTFVMILPFVQIYTKGISDTNYRVPLLAVFLVLSELVYCLRMPYHYMTVAANQFRQTKPAAYGEAGMNIVLSIVLVFCYGLVGVAAATLAAMVFRTIYYAWFLSNHILHRPFGLFVRREAVNGAAFTIICVIGGKVLENRNICCSMDWIISAIAVTVIAVLVTALANMLFYRTDIIAMARRIAPRSGKG
ncbi:polysaccharide biosynthesis C-terminal domain-containing protein [Oscillibacter valericigenes]|uniref:lipopolysaccharide biosynthesis protein n=1 Tax=Oscillibacter valericigenes TaxID=351091 RepID=UPI001F1AB2B1|nr:polysaccharide biosynthesis C-terminal domain-containing protein [Oscillibacter valericigenes]MCF2616118.1 polysaccharide biosynthesis C-terminal domain-containing protein [Oscillibacter valericigenes]